jgi:hypothetical protein
VALNYYDEIITTFKAGYTLAYPVAFDDMPTKDLTGTGKFVDQPTNSPWMRVNTFPGATFKETIATPTTSRKNELFNVSIQVFLPRNTSGSGKFYTRKDFADISNHLDNIMMFDSIVTSDNALITLDQVSPKTTDSSSPMPGDTFQLMVFTYRYNYRYV